MKLYPLKFKPIFKERIWGGRKLETVFGKNLPKDKNIGESWELADLPEDKTVIINGPLAGKNVSQVIELFGQELTGMQDYRPPFPLLIKILDANSVLSVQVHPDAQTCEKMGTGQPKTECWYIIDAAPGACIYKGLVEGTTPEKFRQAIQDGTTEKLLKKIPVQVGECHFLPSGTAHAIGEGLLIAEIQQPSDTTYRVFDWNRVDPNTGQGRELHIEQAMESIHFNSDESKLTVRTSGRLVESPEFSVDKLDIEDQQTLNINPKIMQVVVCVEGAGHILSPESHRVEYNKGDTLLIPAGYEGKIRANAKTQILASQAQNA